MAPLGGELWVLGAGESGLAPVSAALGRTVRGGLNRAGQSLTGLAAAGQEIWLTEPAAHALLRVDTRNVSVHRFIVPGGIRPATVGVGTCGLWVADQAGELALIDTARGALLGSPIRIGRSISALAPSETGVWVTDPIDGTLSRVDLRTAG